MLVTSCWWVLCIWAVYGHPTPTPEVPSLKALQPVSCGKRSGIRQTVHHLPHLSYLAGSSRSWLVWGVSVVASQLFPALAGVSLWGQLTSYPACPAAFLLSKLCGCCLLSSCYRFMSSSKASHHCTFNEIFREAKIRCLCSFYHLNPERNVCLVCVCVCISYCVWRSGLEIDARPCQQQSCHVQSKANRIFSLLWSLPWSWRYIQPFS